MKNSLTKPYLLKATGPQVILFHGYTGSPYDLRPLAQYLFSHNISVQVPLLQGHGKKISNLKATTAQNWLDQAEKIIKLINTDSPVFLGGLSMGALLAILLIKASKINNNICGLILLSPVFEFPQATKLLLYGAKIGLIDSSQLLEKPSGKSDILDPIARKNCPSLSHMPIFGIKEIEKLRKKALAQLNQIRVPIFAAFGQEDAAINISKSHEILLDNTRAPLQIKTYPQSKHVVTLDYDKNKLNKDILNFIQNLPN